MDMIENNNDFLKSSFKRHNVTFSGNDKIAIYGTGKGAQEIFELLCDCQESNRIICFLDNSEVLNEKSELLGYPVKDISYIIENVDVVFIGAKNSHDIVYDRVTKFVLDNKLHIKVWDLYSIKNTFAEYQEYVHYLEKIAKRDYSSTFEEKRSKPLRLMADDPKAIAWYLPQYHRIDINDKFHGKGFTEWTNTSQSLPLFAGHYQPHVPYDVGYYDLTNKDVWIRQIALAKHFGLYGFSFYFYWFSGKRIMERPINQYLEDSDLNFPFCLTWANENWSTLWDGGNRELIFEQKFNENDAESLAEDIVPFFADSRYIKIDGKPLFIVYSATVWAKEDMRSFIDKLRKAVKKRINQELYVLFTNSGDYEENVSLLSGDGLVEFPPHGLYKNMKHIKRDKYINRDFKGSILDTIEYIENAIYLCSHDDNSVYYRGALPYWDNSSRKAFSNAQIYHGLNPKTFEKWLTDIMVEGKKNHGIKENYVFINAWNEWAEGCHLEPDMRYGYGNLNALSRAIENARAIK